MLSWFAVSRRARSNQPKHFAAGAIPAAVPALGELPLDRFSATCAMPRFFHRRQRRQCFFENGSGPDKLFIVEHPKLGPAFDRRQLASADVEIELPSYALDAERCHNILQVADHQWILGAIKPLHWTSPRFLSPRRSAFSLSLSLGPSQSERSM